MCSCLYSVIFGMTIIGTLIWLGGGAWLGYAFFSDDVKFKSCIKSNMENACLAFSFLSFLALLILLMAYCFQKKDDDDCLKNCFTGIFLVCQVINTTLAGIL